MEKRSQFEEKVLGLLNELFGVALRLAKNRDDAEDLVAETITKAWLNRSDIKDPQKFRSWIFRILSNTFISDCRKKSTRPKTEPFTDSYSEESENFSIFEKLHQPFLLWWSNPEKEFLNKILREDLEKAVDSLPDNFRIVVVLSDMEGFSYKEIAGILKLPIGTIRSRLARGRGLLQKILWDHALMAGLVKPEGQAISTGARVPETEGSVQVNVSDRETYEKNKKHQM